MRVLRSVRFNIFLGALIALGSAVGTLLPQIPDAPEKVSVYQQAHPFAFKALDFFGLFDLYHSGWFVFLLGLMALDIVACKLWNRPPDVGLVGLPPELTDEKEAERHVARKEAALRLKPHQARFACQAPPQRALAALSQALRARRYHVLQEFSTAAGSALVASRHRAQRWGSYCAHIGLVVILVGALVKALFGFVEMVPVLEGRSRAMQNKPDWEVYVDKFTVRYYDGTRNPKTFSSVLRVQKGEEVLGAKTIYVNDPLDIGGVRFYQASWGAGGMFRSVTLKVGRQLVQLPQRTPEPIRGTPFTVSADVMMPNFTTADGRADTGSLDLKNPAVRLVFSVGPHKTAPLWLFEQDPKLCLVEDPEGGLARVPPPPFQLAAIDPVLFSGIQVAYDPGYRLVLLGAVLWLVGVVCLFYLHRRRLWLLLEPREGGGLVTIGGWSSRGAQEFEREFDALVDALSAGVGGGASQVSKNPLVEV